MNIKIQQAENSIENVDRSVISALYNAHINGDISQEVDNNNQKIGLIGSIQADIGYEDWVSTLNSAYPKFHVSCNTYYIHFYHQEIEEGIINWSRINVNANFASEGHITQNEADTISIWGKTFTNNKNITQFNEFEKFRNVTEVNQNDCFQGCSNLQSIKLPPRLTYIRGWMFNECSSLSSIILPSSCTYIGTCGFANCTSLESINLNNITKFGRECFSNCPNIIITNQNIEQVTILEAGAFKGSTLSGEISLPNLKSMEDECFKGTSITKLLDLGSVTSIPGRICDGLTTLTEVTIPSTCHTLSGYGHFFGCSNLRKVNGLSNLTNIGNLAFSGTSLINNNLSELVNVTTLNRETFSGCNIQGELNLPNLLSASSSEFAQCKNITKVKCLNKLSSIPEGF